MNTTWLKSLRIGDVVAVRHSKDEGLSWRGKAKIVAIYPRNVDKRAIYYVAFEELFSRSGRMTKQAIFVDGVGMFVMKSNYPWEQGWYLKLCRSPK